MGVKLQLLLGLLLFGLVWGSTENITNSQNDSLEKVDSTNNLIEKLPKTDTQINLEKKDTQEDANDSLKYSKNGLHKSSVTGQEENIENDRIGREGNSRSIDVEKFDSLDFQNNDYPAGNIKFLENAIRKSSTKGYNDFSKLQLTTPKTDFFDSKFKEAKQKLEQEFEDSVHGHQDEHQLEDEIDDVEHDDINIDRLFGNIKQKPNTTLDYKEKTKISRNNTIGDSSEYNEVRVVKMHNINIDSTFNFTTLDDEDTERRETTSQKEQTEATSPRGFEVTTRKTITLTKPPANQNDHILSNKIESETIKAINLLSSEFSTERLRGVNDVLAKEQIVEENKIFPLAEVITEHIKDTRLSSESTEANNDVITTEQIEHTTTVDEPSTLEEKLATLFPQTTTVTNNEITTESLTTEISTITTTEQMENQTSLATETTTIKIEETTIETEKTNLKTEVTTLTSEESTLKTVESTIKTDETTLKTDETTLKTDETTVKTDETTLKTDESALKTNETTLKTDGTTFKTDETTLKIEETTPKTEETTFKTEDTTPNTEESSTENLNRISKSFVFNSSFSILPQTTETTTEPIITTTDISTIINTGIETSTSTSTQETDTETTIKLVMPKRFEMNTTTELKTSTQTTEPNDRINLTTIEFVHVTTKENNTTMMPDTLIPNLNYSTSTSSTIRSKAINISEETTIRVTTISSTEDYSDSTSTGSDVSGLGSGEGNKGKIAAIVISTVGAVCLILLAGLLYIMRKRQKRFNYKQRCRPVSLDDYSVDNGYASTRRKAERQSKRSYGNPAFDDPVAVTHPLNFPALAKFANNTEDIKAEFEEIPQITAKTNELPEGCEVKNRYANVIPLPETRVYLQSIDGYPNSDYINANFVTGPKNTKGYYIACQAPMQNTVDDFWRMVWEQQTKVILMLTHLFENGVEKCIDYLPPSEVLDCNRLFGDFQVTLKKRDVKDKYIISNLQLKNMVSNSWREVTHFWYLGWPEKGVPLEENSIIAFLIEARSYMKSATLDKNAVVNGNLNGSSKNEVNPVVVHCSPGTGRTGVVIACDIAIREFEQTRLVDIPKIVYRIRRDRASAVQTKEQYIFIYKVISLYATKLTGGVLESF